jgi:hypothetical protein
MVLTILYPPSVGVSAASAPTVESVPAPAATIFPLHAIHRANSYPFRSIIIIHGLNGDVIESWTNAATKAFWPKDFLPRDVPEARVMAFGYNANAAFGNTTADIVDHAKDLLGSLLDTREEGDEKLRSIIFIAHSVGGIVVKQVCNSASVPS